jgi:hypothetical protein
MTTALVAGVFGLLGTVLGSVIAIRAARENADRVDRRAREVIVRGEYRSSVVSFASAVLEYQLAEMDRWHARRGGRTDPNRAAETVYSKRTAAWHALFELELSTDDPELGWFARRIVDKTRSIEVPEEQDEMDQRALEVREEVAAMIGHARERLNGQTVV